MKKYLVSVVKKIQNKLLKCKRHKYIEILRDQLNCDTSIICTNCLGGRIMQDLGMQYNTPTLGLFFVYPDYIEFLSNLRYYIQEASLEFITQSRYEEYNRRRANWAFPYPIGILDNKVEIHFLHYHSVEEAKDKWIRRAKRINWNKLLIIGIDQNSCTEKDIIAFDRLPYKNRVFFSSRQVSGDSIIIMKEFENSGKVGDPYKKGHVFYKYLVNYLNSNPLK